MESRQVGQMGVHLGLGPRTWHCWDERQRATGSLATTRRDLDDAWFDEGTLSRLRAGMYAQVQHYSD